MTSRLKRGDIIWHKATGQKAVVVVGEEEYLNSYPYEKDIVLVSWGFGIDNEGVVKTSATTREKYIDDKPIEETDYTSCKDIVMTRSDYYDLYFAARSAKNGLDSVLDFIRRAANDMSGERKE
jgi:hypothetical protein